ncbi:MAG TPA: peptidase M28 family protein, partial [Thermoanaerobaculia bacterium]|nr:peptidase M28 family protein [Thermoanaerobaculia bacterium]
MKRFLVIAILGTASFAAASLSRGADAPVLSPEVRRTAEALREKAFAGTKAVDWVRSLTDEVGPRLSGSPGDAAGVAWALATLKAVGFTNVHVEKVMVPAWQRGVETGEVTAPYRQRLILAALGGSPPTPEAGLEAEIVEAGSLEALEAKGAAAVKDKIV